MSDNRIAIIGCGPGSPDYLTPAAIKAAEAADVLVGAARLLEMFGGDAERIVVGVDIKQVLDEIAERLNKKNIAVLVSGDTGLFSLAKNVIERFGAGRCEVIPGVSSVQVAFARIGLDWHDAKIISIHGRDLEADAASLAGASKIAILIAGESSIADVEKLIEAAGGDRAIFVCENLTLVDESVRRVEVSELGKIAIASRTIILVIEKEQVK
jgi:precorrin-6y C5,15-methyltransferase (decarboxylating) CbiE subunit